MSNVNKEQVGYIWLIVIVIAVILSFLLVIFSMTDLIWLPISFMIIIGCAITLLTQFFFDPKKHCPRCDTPIPSVYTEKCVRCGLQLLTKCSDCNKYLNTYVNGAPVQFCGQCGSKLAKEIEKIKISTTLESYIATAKKVNFCPTCGVNLDEEDSPHYCPLCGGEDDGGNGWIEKKVKWENGGKAAFMDYASSKGVKL